MDESTAFCSGRKVVEKETSKEKILTLENVLRLCYINAVISYIYIHTRIRVCLCVFIDFNDSSMAVWNRLYLWGSEISFWVYERSSASKVNQEGDKSFVIWETTKVLSARERQQVQEWHKLLKAAQLQQQCCGKHLYH